MSHCNSWCLAARAGCVDYLVDALALHDHLPLLRPLMADPSVLKVLHGGGNDIAWLQRDAHVYVVNAFDTEKAAQVGRFDGGTLVANEADETAV